MGKLVERVRRGFRQVQRFFHLAVALVFLFLAVSGAVMTFEMWQEHRRQAHGSILGLTVMAGFAALLMIFALYSFAKARSVR